MSMFDGIEKLKDKSLLAGLLLFVIFISPGFLTILYFERELFIQLESIKLLVLATAIVAPMNTYLLLLFMYFDEKHSKKKENKNDVDSFFTWIFFIILLSSFYLFLVLLVIYYNNLSKEAFINSYIWFVIIITLLLVYDALNKQIKKFINPILLSLLFGFLLYFFIIIFFLT